jgi:hypothetical protein
MSALHVAIREHGEQAFVSEILYAAKDRTEAHRLEREWIMKLRSHDPAHGFNGTFGGFEDIPANHVRKKMSAVAKGIPKSREHAKSIQKARWSEEWNHTLESRAKISATQRAANPNPSKRALQARRRRDRKRLEAGIVF